MSGPDQAPTGLLKICIGLGIAEANEVGAGPARKKGFPWNTRHTGLLQEVHGTGLPG